jgi:multiple sugar transport system permease protein
MSTRAYSPQPSTERLQRLAGKAVPHIILLIVAFAAVYPFVWLTFASFKNFKELMSTATLLPQEWTLENYREILTRVNFSVAFRNSLVQAITVTIATLATSTLLGYIFAKYHYWGKEALFNILLLTMMVPFAVVLVPIYLVVAQMGMIDKLAGIIVTGLWSTFGVFMMRQFMETIPMELIDAARIDGASEWRIFSTIVLPIAQAPIGALAIFVFLGNWDSFLWPLVVLSSPQNQTLPLLLAGLRSLYWTRYDMWAAGSMFTILPVMLIYALSSRYFIQGIAMTGLKA